MSHRGKMRDCSPDDRKALEAAMKQKEIQQAVERMANKPGNSPLDLAKEVYQNFGGDCGGPGPVGGCGGSGGGY